MKITLKCKKINKTIDLNEIEDLNIKNVFYFVKFQVDKINKRINSPVIVPFKAMLKLLDKKMFLNETLDNITNFLASKGK